MTPEMEQFAVDVRRDAQRIMAAAATGQNHRAGELAAALCTRAAGVLSQSQMSQEQAGDYDLAALIASVDVSAPSSSENPFENE